MQLLHFNVCEYLKKNKGCNYSLCHVLNCHVDVDPKHVVCDEANEDKNGNMNPPNQMLCDMLLIILVFRRILKNRQFPNLGITKIGTLVDSATKSAKRGKIV